MGSVKTILVTVSDDRQGRKDGVYGITQRKVYNLFMDHIEIGITPVSYTISDLLELPDCPEILHEIDPGMNGRAYKPFVILKELEKLNKGDFLIYNDVSPEIWANESGGCFICEGSFDISIIQNLTMQNNDILTSFVKWDYLSIPSDELGLHLHKYFTLNSCMDKMGMREYENCYMPASGMMCIRKTPDSVRLVEEWLQWNVDPDCCSLKNWEEEKDFKVGHRHDQSILGLLLNARNASFVDILYNEMSPYNFLQFCRPDTEYRFIPGNNTPQDRELEFNKIFIRPGSNVINQAGVLLEIYRIDWINGVETFIVGQHPESCYATTRDKIKII